MKKQRELKAECVGKIDTDLIPEVIRMGIARTLYYAILEDSQKPEFQERLQRWKAAKTKRATAQVQNEDVSSE